MPLTLATWNINSVRLREGLVKRLLTEEAPDILCVQECKSPVEKMPLETFAQLGYGHVVARGRLAGRVEQADLDAFRDRGEYGKPGAALVRSGSQPLASCCFGHARLIGSSRQISRL